MNEVYNIELPRSATKLRDNLAEYMNAVNPIMLKILSRMFDGYCDGNPVLDKEYILKEVEIDIVDILYEELNIGVSRSETFAKIITDGVRMYFNALENDLLKVIENYGINPVRLSIINIIGNTMIIGDS